jgi:hypothetical protein
VRLLSGEASLVGDLQIEPKTVRGELLVEAQDVGVGLEAGELSGDLRLDLLIADGAPADLRFDLAGSRIYLEDFRVAGQTASYGQPGWDAHFEIEKCELVWAKPLRLEFRALGTVEDTRPFVALLDNVRGEHAWIDRLLEAEDLAGHIELALDGKRTVLSDALFGGQRTSIGAKGLADAKGLEGLLFLRWHDWGGALSLQGGERHFHLIGARRMFDAYVPGRTAMAPKGPDGTATPNWTGVEEP